MSSPHESFEALVLDRVGNEVIPDVRLLERDALPDGDVLVRVEWSGINYKDALAVTNRGKVVRTFPMVPGIDLAGTVVESQSEQFSSGDSVLVTGYGTGEDRWGGYSQLARVQSKTVVSLPDGLTTRTAMALGTAGFTAMLAVFQLSEHGVVPERGPVLVTGASGGVGSFSVALLSQLGYQVVASTGRPEMDGYLTGLGAQKIVDRHELSDAPARPLSSETWSGAIDSVGGTTLGNILSVVKRHGCVASCGLAGGPDLRTTVFPFILRGVTLAGIDSNYCPMGRRQRAWRTLAAELAEDTVETIVQSQVALEGVPEASSRLMDGEIRGRLLVELS